MKNLSKSFKKLSASQKGKIWGELENLGLKIYQGAANCNLKHIKDNLPEFNKLITKLELALVVDTLEK